MNFLIDFINIAFNIYSWLIIIRILLSWIPVNPYSPIVSFITSLTDPYLNLFRRIIPPVGMIDFSPIAAFFVLEVIRMLLLQLLLMLG
ncbi:YggT family protein [Carboxydothermus pertinax]|uniref:YggT family protein n=1 Tax=Carboxydothermus pertinax TaxID=870242 RepID=A0A1L8CSH3_9THEO|nr:YggT family protein [Carboxydothermus pertinax]GAV21804.1 YggT family protein [Carboxydothermus pertinax]